jgi:polyisoprenyl-phosphate glycosyltransferase
MSPRPFISAVVPVYRCEPCLRVLHERLVASLTRISPDFEIVLVEDSGGDGSWETIHAIARDDARVRGLRLSRNFGQHAAITAGLSEARGEWMVVLDCDLQDPPEKIPELYEKAREGYDIVFGRRKEKATSWSRRQLGRLYFKALAMFGTGPTKIEGQYGTFSLISRKVVDSFLRFKDKDRHYLFILNWLGFDTTAVEYEPAERFAGESSYTFRALLKHGFDGMFFQTTVLLRWIVYAGFAFAALGALMAVYLVVSKLTGSAYPGFTTIAVLILTVGGFTIISTGITGLYIGKVFDQVKERPLFVIASRIEEAHETPVDEPVPEVSIGTSHGA